MGDKRTDSGQFYPGGKVIPRQPVRPGGGSDADAVHYYAETKTETEKAQARANIGAMAAGDIPTHDDAVTSTSANGVKSSGIWSAIWGTLTALPTGFTSLYDWCVAKFAGKRDLDDLKVYEKVGVGDDWSFVCTPQLSGEESIICVGYERNLGGWGFLSNIGASSRIDKPESAYEIEGELPVSIDPMKVVSFVATRANEFRPVSPSDLLAKVSQLDGKVDKVSGKGLSQNDYTNADKAEVAKVEKKADEFSKWVAAGFPSDYQMQDQPTYQQNYLQWGWLGTKGDGSVCEFVADGTLATDTDLVFKDAESLVSDVTATRKRVLRTGDAPATSDIIDPALAEAVGNIADAKLTRDLVNLMVSTNSAHYLTARAGTAGAYTYPPFASAAALRAALAAHTEQSPQFFYAGEAFTPTKNDWVIVSEDEDHPLGTITPASRYGFVGTFGSGGSFQYQVSYKLPLTTAQIAALDSEITNALVLWLTQFKGTDTATTLASIIAKLALLETDGKASDTFATDLLGKQVAITAIDARIKTNAESAAEPINTVTLNDNAPKTVTVATVESPATPSLAVTFGTARNGGLRICELYILNGTADTDLTFDSAVHFVSTGDSFPACEAGINYFVFAEVAANLWKVTRETLKSITTPTPVEAA